MAWLMYRENMDDWRSIYLRVMELITLVVSANALWNEAAQRNPTAYSKFAHATKARGTMLPSKTGMLLTYSPPGIAALLIVVGKVAMNDFAPGNTTNMRFWLVAGALILHYSKRLLEVQFVHRYSGTMGTSAVTVICTHYTLMTLNLLLAQHVADPLPPPAVDTTWMGIAAYFLGMAGNFYHHVLLRNMRKDGSKKYTIPQGGLFPTFVAPHYVCEFIQFMGLALIAQTTFSLVTVIGIGMYLGSRSYGTKQWYRANVDGYPMHRCVIFPGLL